MSGAVGWNQAFDEPITDTDLFSTPTGLIWGTQALRMLTPGKLMINRLEQYLFHALIGCVTVRQNHDGGGRREF